MNKNWEKEFNDLFPTLSVSTKNMGGLGYDLVHRTKEVKFFVSDLLYTQRQNIIRRIEDYIDAETESYKKVILKDLLTDLREGNI